MAKLPANMVKAPKFDNPIRRTSKPELAVVEEPAVVEAAPVKATPALAPRPAPAPAPARTPISEPPPSSHGDDEVITSATELTQDSLCHRFSVRLTQPQWEALQTRCFQLRLRGERMNSAELIRRIVDDWIERKPATP